MSEINCRHCGTLNDAPDDADFLCKNCGHWHNTVACPVCHQPVHVSLLPADLVPAPHKPVKSEEKP